MCEISCFVKSLNIFSHFMQSQVYEFDLKIMPVEDEV